jgi:hypothetical protein
MDTGKESMKRASLIEYVPLALIALFAALVRFLAFSQPYHQDEFKWLIAADPRFTGGADSIPHPFLAESVFHYVGLIVGFTHLRLVPIVLSLLTLALLYIYMRRYFGRTAAVLSTLVWSADLYVLLGSVQIDIDGAFLPLATLLAFFGYALFREGTVHKRWWLTLLVAGLLIGFSSKLSFVLAAGAIVLHYVWERPAARRYLLRRGVLLTIGALIIVGGALLFVVWDHVLFLQNISNFVALSGRSYSQLLFETLKALIYLSPLLVLVAVAGLRRWRSLSLWYMFLGLNVLFYYVIFDFSHRTMDKYLFFMILPLTVIAGPVLSGWLSELRLRLTMGTAALFALWSAAISTFTLWIFLSPHRIAPLLPKVDFLSSFVHLRWGFLLPLFGGSGPLGFYLPFDWIAYVWGISVIALALLVARGIPSTVRRHALAAFLCASAVFSLFAMNEYLFGTFYGSAPRVLSEMLSYTVSSSIPDVISYNETGAFELSNMGKYNRRFYADPLFAEDNVGKFQSYDGHYFVLNFPEINPDLVYWKYFQQCKTVFGVTDKRISGYIFDCRSVPFTP